MIIQLCREKAGLEIYNSFLLSIRQRIWSLCVPLGCAIGLMTQIEVYRLLGERFTPIPHNRAQEL